jgi:hypothetical protein
MSPNVALVGPKERPPSTTPLLMEVSLIRTYGATPNAHRSLVASALSRAHHAERLEP